MIDRRGTCANRTYYLKVREGQQQIHSLLTCEWAEATEDIVRVR